MYLILVRSYLCAVHAEPCPSLPPLMVYGDLFETYFLTNHRAASSSSCRVTRELWWIGGSIHLSSCSVLDLCKLVVSCRTVCRSVLVDYTRRREEPHQFPSNSMLFIVIDFFSNTCPYSLHIPTRSSGFFYTHLMLIVEHFYARLEESLSTNCGVKIIHS